MYAPKCAYLVFIGSNRDLVSQRCLQMLMVINWLVLHRICPMHRFAVKCRREISRRIGDQSRNNGRLRPGRLSFLFW